MITGKRFFRLAVLLVLSTGLLFGGCSGIGGVEGNYYAVIVGVSLYQVSKWNLNYADDDAIDFRNVILTGENWDPGRITMLLNGQATRAAIQNAIFNMAARMGPDDYFVFFFSGHGTFGPDFAPVDEPDGLDEFLVPHDSLETVWDLDIRDEELENWLLAVPGSNVAVILDSSFSGGMSKGTHRVKSISRPWNEEQTSTPRHGMRDIGNSGYVVITASQPHESPIETSILGNGVFTYYLVEGLYGPANVDGNGFISTEEGYNYSAPRSTAFYGGMHPYMKDLHSGQYKLVIR